MNWDALSRVAVTALLALSTERFRQPSDNCPAILDSSNSCPISHCQEVDLVPLSRQIDGAVEDIRGDKTVVGAAFLSGAVTGAGVVLSILKCSCVTHGAAAGGRRRGGGRLERPAV